MSQSVDVTATSGWRAGCSFWITRSTEYISVLLTISAVLRFLLSRPSLTRITPPGIILELHVEDIPSFIFSIFCLHTTKEGERARFPRILGGGVTI